jgi:hypothetical protein
MTLVEPVGVSVISPILKRPKKDTMKIALYKSLSYDEGTIVSRA